MAEARVRAKGQITIPREIRELAHLEEGDRVEVVMVPEGILLIPRKVVEASQAWFRTPGWQAGEREASLDIAQGRVEVFESEGDFLDSLGD